MIYRIHFEPKGGSFVLQFQKFFMCWETVQKLEGKAGEKPMHVPLTFDTYDAAEQYVKEKGIDKAYDRRDTKGYVTAMQAGQVVQANVPHGYKLVPQNA